MSEEKTTIWERLGMTRAKPMTPAPSKFDEAFVNFIDIEINEAVRTGLSTNRYVDPHPISVEIDVDQKLDCHKRHSAELDAIDRLALEAARQGGVLLEGCRVEVQTDQDGEKQLVLKGHYAKVDDVWLAKVRCSEAEALS